MDTKSVALWMQLEINQHGCLYHDDVVDYITKSHCESLLRENVEGNLVLSREVLNEFKKLNECNIVWVKPDKYWRFRVPEDEDIRESRG